MTMVGDLTQKKAPCAPCNNGTVRVGLNLVVGIATQPVGAEDLITILPGSTYTNENK